MEKSACGMCQAEVTAARDAGRGHRSARQELGLVRQGCRRDWDGETGGP